MPGSFDNERLEIMTLRGQRISAEQDLAINENLIRELEIHQAGLQRRGASAAEIEAVKAQITAAGEARAGLIGQVRDVNAGIAKIIGTVVVNVNPEILVRELDGLLPVAMLPVRLETRFFDNRELRIRIFPDQIHMDNHIPELLPVEVELGQWYWKMRFHGDEAQTRSAWEEVARRLTPTRAAWVIRLITPTNQDTAPNAESLQFPNPPVRQNGSTRAARATLLPDHWVAVGYERINEGVYNEVFRKWAVNSVPDTLNLGPSFERLAEVSTVQDEPPVDAEMRWMTDYNEALTVGMAITVTQDDMFLDKNLANGVDLLVVLGIDWTLTPEQTALNLANLLHAHQFSDGLSFIPQSTPTNNTSLIRSGFSTDPLALASEMNPDQPPILDPIHSASARMRTGLGLPQGVADLSLAPHAGLRESRVAGLMIDAIWGSTLGYFLDELLDDELPDPLITDMHIDLARDHAAHYLRPSGPFSAFRVGKQPYGLLPVIASQRFVPDREAGFEAKLLQVATVLSWYWRQGVAAIPRMGSTGNPDSDLLKLLQHNPVSTSKRYRWVVDAETIGNTKGYGHFAAIQSDILRSMVLPVMASVSGPFFKSGKIARMITSPGAPLHFGPWVQAGSLEEGAPLQPNYISNIAQTARDGTNVWQALTAIAKSTNLLEAMLALAALYELDYTGGKILAAHLVEIGQIQAVPKKARLRVHSLLGVYQPPEVVAATAAGQVYLESAEQQANLVVPALTGDRPIADFISQQVVFASERPELHNLTTFLADLDELSTFPAAELDRAFRSALDSYAYRLDAWFTSLAERRLETLRGMRPDGVYAGGYGWVENLRPDPAGRSESLGYIHTPSLTHASAAALLRSGHLSHRGAENAGMPVAPGTERSALNVDLSSERVRIALGLIEGAAQGQPLAALLGYRFERGLRDRDIQLAKFILPIRKLSPYRATSPDATSGPSESIAARDVVDGVTLLDMWRRDPNGLLNSILDPRPTPNEREGISAELNRLDNMLDAVSDVLVSEAVYQTVAGNWERAGAALAALDRQSRPPDPQVVRTPRSGMLYQQRVAVMAQSADAPAGWPEDPRARAEPRLNAWIAGRIGDLTNIRLAARVIQDDNVIEDLSSGLTELGLSPLSLVLASVAAGDRLPSELEQRLAQVFAAQVANPGPEMALELLEAPPAGSPAGTIGLGALRALLQMLNSLLTRGRALDARDLVPPEGNLPPGFDLDDLTMRAFQIIETLENTITSLENSLTAASTGALRSALFEAAAIGAVDALPTRLDPAGADLQAHQELTEQAERVRAALEGTRRRVHDTQIDFQSPEETDPAFQTAKANHLVACIRIILSESFPILPVFTPANSDEMRASLADRAALLAPSDDFAPLSWLQQMATVRPEIDNLTSALVAAEMLGVALVPQDFQVVQFPHTPGEAWAALTRPAPPTEPLLAVVLVGRFDPDAPLAGLFCDGWSEVIPASTEMTGMTFHFDVPAARPPQTVLLAVPPDLSQPHWTFDALLDTVLETFNLARLRAVGPGEIPALGGSMLPTIYLLQDKTDQQPSIDMERVVDVVAHATSKVYGKVKTDGS